MRLVILYNPLSNNGHGGDGIQGIKSFYSGVETEVLNVLEVENMEKLLAELPQEDRVILCGGDGTIHHFVNDVDCEKLSRDIYFFSAGSGNDFIRDIGKKTEDGPFLLNPYLLNLPVVTVNGKSYKFINNVGYGIDGYVCEEADIQRVTSKKKINYTTIALKGLMGGYTPANAVVIVDGIRKNYKDVWLAPTMKGKYCGGGMMLSPNQDRMDADACVTVPVMYGVGKINALLRFKKVIKGEHLRFTNMVDVMKGHEVEVIFDTPCALQVDGETILGVYKYVVSA